MRDERFFDTNVLIYAFAAGDPRSARAEALLAEGGVTGVQVLNEFTHAARRKLGWAWPQIDEALAVITDLVGPTRALTVEIHCRAVELALNSSLPIL